MKHERETLEKVIAAQHRSDGERGSRGRPGQCERDAGLIVAEGALSGALSRLFALVEAYPDLKANQNMMQLTEELTGPRTRSRSRGRRSTTR